MLLSLCKIVVYYLLTYLTGALCLLMQIFAKRKKASGIPLQTGKVAIVTGGSEGIGFYVSKGLVAKNVHVVIGGKCKEAGTKAIRDIQQDFPNAKVDFVHMDLSSLKSVKDFAEYFLAKYEKLNILVNNAGVMFPDYQLTEDGFESQFQINYLGHFYLTQLLLDRLRQSGLPNSWSRIINVSSSVHLIGYPDVQVLGKSIHRWSDYSCHKAYADSKLMIVASTYKQSQLLCSDNAFVSLCALHPGVVWSGLWKHVTLWIHRLPLMLVKKLFLDAEQGAETVLFAALSPEVEGQSGCYYDNAESVDSATLTYNADFQNELWSKTLELLDSARQTE